VSVICLPAFSKLLHQCPIFLPFPSFLQEIFLNLIIYVISGKPKYEGSFPPNRFGIPPGYRWDAVDRSNGYEKQWFEKQNSRQAVEEEAYKWSTADM
jgi:hypothetical protein